MEPAAIVASWAGGIAAGSALVVSWGIVGPGYRWLSLGVAAGAGAIAAASGSGVAAWVGVTAALGGIFLARRIPPTVVAASMAATMFLLAAAGGGVAVLAVTGGLLLGGITSEMMLGHWYLVDPRLPRPALRRLAAIGGVGVVVDVVAVLGLRVAPWSQADLVVLTAWVVLAITTVLLMVGVWFALGERGYAGVMAATGLSYLAVLTGIGVAVVGRILQAAAG